MPFAIMLAPFLFLAGLWAHDRIEDRKEIQRLEQRYQTPLDYGAGKPAEFEEPK